MRHTVALAILILIVTITLSVTAALNIAPRAFACETARAELSAARDPAEVDRGIARALAACRP